MFYTNKSIRLHSKCLAILEMIQKAGNKAEDHKLQIKSYDKRIYFTKSWHEKRLCINQELRDRLVKYYAKTMLILCEDVVAKCYTELETA